MTTLKTIRGVQKIKRFKYKGLREGPGHIRLAVAGLGRQTSQAALDEHLTGIIQDLAASAGEERSARALDKNQNVMSYQFRLPLGAPRNMPGFKELDLLVQAKSGIFYAIEIDTAFTHRMKANADKLHDAIILQELSYLPIFPHVFHVGDGPDSEENASVATQDQANETFRRLIV